jgi:hypothetical protein
MVESGLQLHFERSHYGSHNTVLFPVGSGIRELSRLRRRSRIARSLEVGW